jgi:BirA family biotin operon repressor/biotin-[acetyl-CoA-carboxylase] ligase
LSCVLKPEASEIVRLPLANVSQLMALAACHVLEGYEVKPALKWPNDILVSGQKIAGILAETVTEGTRLLGLVIGIGVNLNLSSEVLAGVGQPATSLNLLKGHPIEVTSFREALLSAFFESYDSFLKQGFLMIRSEYLQRFHYCGKQVAVKTGGQSVQGTVLTINSDGALELREANGTVRVITLGEIFSAQPAE